MSTTNVEKKARSVEFPVISMRSVVIVFVAATVVGCGVEAKNTFTKVGSAIGGGPRATAPAVGFDDSGSMANEEKVATLARLQRGPRDVAVAEAVALAPAVKNPEPVSRKIIYSANLQIIVEDFAAAEAKFRALVSQQKDAYIAKADVHTSPGMPRSGTWTVRIPVGGFDAFLAAVGALGELSGVTRDSQDVTDQFYDTDARLRNKRVEEERLIKHLDRPNPKLEDILAVEKEISRVRGEIEQLQGRLNYLSQLSALTTVTVVINERKGYQPPEPVAPTFGTVLTRRFQGSVQGLIDVGQGVVIFVVVMAPWVVVFGIIGVPAVLLVRRVAAAHRAAPPALPATDAGATPTGSQSPDQPA